MRTQFTRLTSKEVWKAFGERNYRNLMLGFMGVELILLLTMVVVEVLDYLKR